jgi:hypothetical protein
MVFGGLAATAHPANKVDEVSGTGIPEPYPRKVDFVPRSTKPMSQPSTPFFRVRCSRVIRCSNEGRLVRIPKIETMRDTVEWKFLRAKGELNG